jgi:5-oxoprolinase (ATP-hydrolysing) subunit C
MAGSLRVVGAGPGNTVQDAGRRGFLRFGVTPAGPMDWQAFRTAHLALGNDPAKDAALEISLGGLELVCDGAPLWVAFCGGEFSWVRGIEDVGLAARLHLMPGDSLRIRPGRFGAYAYLAVAGGFATPRVLGSRATHTRSMMGGIDGRALKAGDSLPCGDVDATTALFEARIKAPWLARDASPMRVILGPQDDYFSDAAIETFFASDYRLTIAADRMAYKLEGPDIAHTKGFNIITDGVALGAIQIAGDKQPLILMGDRQPTGGYPKIGHVARVDIVRLAQLRPGETCRFVEVSTDQARDALIAREDEIARTADYLQPLKRAPSTEDLLRLNLVGGVTRGDDGAS